MIKEEEVKRKIDEFMKKNKISGDGLAIAFVLSSEIEKLRPYVEQVNRDNPASVENALDLCRKGLRMDNIHLDTVNESLLSDQMREDLNNALIVTMGTKDPAAVIAGMLYLKGVIIPLEEALKKAQQTIRTLMVVAGQNSQIEEVGNG